MKVCSTCEVKEAVRSSLCKECRAAYDRSRKAYHKKYKETHRADHSTYMKEYRKKNAERLQELEKDYHARNPGLKISLNAKYRAAKLQATPAWADDRYIRLFYEMAAADTILTGIEHQVDHIVPLQSDIVCGLHWEQNLQVLPAADNLSKSNRWWPDMPEQL